MRWDKLCELAKRLPEVAVGTWYATPGLLVAGKGFVRLKEDGASVVFLTADLDEREALLAGRPDIYFITDHYAAYPAVLARLSALTQGEALTRLERSWRQKAKAKLVQRLDAEVTTRYAAKPRKSPKRRS